MDAPGLWLERISLPELDGPAGRLTAVGAWSSRQAGGSGGRPQGRSAGCSRGRLLLGHPEVPLEQDVLPLGVPDDPLPVAPVLRVVRGQQDQPGVGAAPELLDEGRVAEVGADLPVRGDRAEVDDPDVADRGLRLCSSSGRLGSSVTGAWQ